MTSKDGSKCEGMDFANRDYNEIKRFVTLERNNMFHCFSCYDVKGLLKSKKNTRLADGGILKDEERKILQKFYDEKCYRRNSDDEEVDEEDEEEDEEDEEDEDDSADSSDSDGYTQADYARLREMESYMYSYDYNENPHNYHN
jgi:hypothetical protein